MSPELSEILDQPCTPEGVHLLADAGLVDRDRATGCLEAGPESAVWLRWADVGLLWGGVVLIATSVLYLVAFNWDALGKFGQGGLLAVGLAAVAGVAARRAGSTLGSASLAAAQALVGALLAWFGQTYQTGADPYSLFLAWAVFTLPWAWVGETSVLWLIQGALWNTAIGLYAAQVLDLGAPTVHVLTAFNLGVWWIAASRAPRWLGLALLCFLLGFHVLGAWWWIFDERTLMSVGPSLGLGAAIAVSAAHLGRRVPGVWGLAAVALLAELCSLEARLLYQFGEMLGADLLVGSVLLALAGGLALGQAVALGSAIRRMNVRFHKGNP
jgi:hypothetical protein